MKQIDTKKCRQAIAQKSSLPKIVASSGPLSVYRCLRNIGLFSFLATTVACSSSGNNEPGSTGGASAAAMGGSFTSSGGVDGAGGGSGGGVVDVNAGGTVANAGGADPSSGGQVGTGSVSQMGGTTSAVGGGGIEGSGGAPGDLTGPYPFPADVPDTDGAELWLRFPKVPVATRLAEYQAALTHVVNSGTSETLMVAEAELVSSLGGLTETTIAVNTASQGAGAVVMGTPTSSPLIAGLPLAARLAEMGPEGYIVELSEVEGQSAIAVAANTDVGVLYGTYALLRHLQSHRAIENIQLAGSPQVEHRVLNHWDNLNRSVERGYAGQSLWNWTELPNLSPRYREYARANASIGINGTVLTNVNADADVLTPNYLNKVKALADVFRPYGIAVYLTAPFNAPEQLGGSATSDPSNAGVQDWWKQKADEIYALIPDFGGFLIKANSEGQPGPLQYGRTHAEGANMLADAVGASRGIVMWRAFVYSETSTPDRIREAYDEFKPLDGQFRDNVLVQTKNGALDFQPREPFAPLFGGMPDTPLALELQITKEYLGQDTHLAYVGPMYEEILQSDTFAAGAGSTVARVVDGSIHGYSTTAMAGVANIGSDANWSGSQFNQANWYAFGRMAWDPDLTAAAVADEWVRQTLSNDLEVVTPVVQLMMASHQALVDYMTPLGLVHIMASTHHYGPGPWVSDLSRPEWNPVYYHKADTEGLGFDRTASGSNAVAQYKPEVAQLFADPQTVPEEFLLFFHHVKWTDTLSSGRTLWDELVHRYSVGVDEVQKMRDAWALVEGRVDDQRFAEITQYLEIQHYEARWWRDACLSYFAGFANAAFPAGYVEPNQPLSYYQGLTDNNCPGNRDKPRCPAIETGEPSPTVLAPQ